MIIIRDYGIKIIAVILFLVLIMILGYVFLAKKNEIRRIGDNTGVFDIVFKNWDENQNIKEFHKLINKMNEPYLLLECGTINGTSQHYYLIDFNKKQIRANFFKINGRFLIKEKVIDELLQHIKHIKSENKIYEGISTNLDDGVYLLTYHNKNQSMKFGFYALTGFYDRFPNKQIEEIAMLNRVTFYKIIDLIEKEIFRQRPQLFKERQFFSTYF